MTTEAKFNVNEPLGHTERQGEGEYDLDDTIIKNQRTEARKRMFLESKARIEAQRILFKVPKRGDSTEAMRSVQNFDDPKTGSVVSKVPLPDTDPNEKFNSGDNQHGTRKQAARKLMLLKEHANEKAFEKGQDFHMQADPSQLRMSKLMKVYQMAMVTRASLIEKYGITAFERKIPEGLLGQTDRQGEYDCAGRIIKGQETVLSRSKYEEDMFINNHTTVWGSWWKDHQWGYNCCKQMIRNSYCTGAAGMAAEAATDLMRANIARKEITEDKKPAPMEDKKLATWATDMPDDLVLDQKRLTETLK